MSLTKIMTNPPKVAIVCDWLTGTGGAERVVLEIHRMFPGAPIYTSQYDTDPTTWYGGTWFKDADVRTGWLQKLPKGLRKFLPVLRAWYFSRLNLSDYDLVISSSGAEAKGIRLNTSKWLMANGKSNMKKPLHISYIHAPTHYYWSRYEQYLKNPGFGPFDWLARIGLKILVSPMRRWDLKAAQRPDVMIANSRHTQAQIKKYYGCESVVIHPPVDTARFHGPMPAKRSGFVITGRQTPYKRIDLAVRACTKLQVPLTVIGKGPDHEKLRRKAGRTVTFLTTVSDDAMKEDFKSAQAFIFPGLDDFGITPVEAMAAGTPVVAYKAGGALDYVIEGKTGMFFEEQTVVALSKVLTAFKPEQFNSNFIAKHAEQFSVATFHRKITQLLEQVISKSQR